MRNPQQFAPESGRNLSQSDAVTCIVIVTFFVILTWYGAAFHYVEMCYSTEYDRYVEQADQLLQGQFPKDPFHPLLYPALAAAAGKVLGNTFSGARSVSTLAAVGLLIVTYLLGIACFNRRTAALATTALAFNSLVFMCGFETGTDMLFAVLGLLCVYACVRVMARPARGLIVALGVCFALAYVTRYAAVALVPCLAVTMWKAPFPSRASRWGGIAILVGTLVLCLVPHFALNTRIFGSPWAMRQGDNLVRKVKQVRPDLFTASPAAVTPIKLVIEAPLAVIGTTLDTAKAWTVDGVAGFVGGNRIFLSSALFCVAFLGGLVVNRAGPGSSFFVPLIYLASYFALICGSMEPLPRLILPILPVCMLLAMSFLDRGMTVPMFALRGVPVSLGVLAVALFLALLPIGAFQALSDMVSRHPYRELDAAQSLERTVGKDVVVAGTFPFMQRYVGYRYVHVTDDFGNRGPEDRTRYFTNLRTALKARHADYLIVGAPSLGARPVELLTGNGIPDFLQPEFVQDGLSLYRVRRDKL